MATETKFSFQFKMGHTWNSFGVWFATYAEAKRAAAAYAVKYFQKVQVIDSHYKAYCE